MLYFIKISKASLQYWAWCQCTLPSPHQFDASLKMSLTRPAFNDWRPISALTLFTADIFYISYSKPVRSYHSRIFIQVYDWYLYVDDAAFLQCQLSELKIIPFAAHRDWDISSLYTDKSISLLELRTLALDQHLLTKSFELLKLYDQYFVKIINLYNFFRRKIYSPVLLYFFSTGFWLVSGPGMHGIEWQHQLVLLYTRQKNNSHQDFLIITELLRVFWYFSTTIFTARFWW